MVVEAVFNTGLYSAGALLLAVFTAARVLLWAILVVTAWFEIVEKPFEEELKRTKKPKTTDPGPEELTKTALQQHEAANTVDKLEHQKEQQAPGTPPAPPARRFPAQIPHISGISDDADSESVDAWSIWGEENEASGHGGAVAEQHHHNQRPEAQPHLTQERIVQETTYSAAPQTRGQVVAPAPLKGGVRPPISVTSLEEPKKRGDSKKPFVTRKLEQIFVSPYKQQYEHLGYFMYRGLNKIGVRVETSVNSLAKELDGAIRDAGVEAVNRVEVVMRRYMKFFGAVAVLSVVLLPLPSVHISLGVA